jgi:hypothetical protein
MSVVGIDHVQVAAPRGCETEARRFYGTLLGLVGRFYSQDPWGNRIELLA